MDVKLAGDVFGAKAKNPDRHVALIYGKVNGNKKDQKIGSVTVSDNIKSKLVKLCTILGIPNLNEETYEELIGKTVNVNLSSTGFWNLEL